MAEMRTGRHQELRQKLTSLRFEGWYAWEIALIEELVERGFDAQEMHTLFFGPGVSHPYKIRTPKEIQIVIDGLRVRGLSII